MIQARAATNSAGPVPELPEPSLTGAAPAELAGPGLGHGDRTGCLDRLDRTRPAVTPPGGPAARVAHVGTWSMGGANLRRKTCADSIALLTEYLEGGLSPPDRVALEEHLAGCAACAGYLRSLKTTRSAVGRLRHDAIPEELHDRLRSFLRLRLSTSRARDSESRATPPHR